MKILYIDISIKGHRAGYLKALADNSSCVALLPELCEEISCKQYCMYSNYNKKRSLKSYNLWIKEITDIILIENIDLVHFLCGDCLYRYFGIWLNQVHKPIIVTFHHIKLGFLRKISLCNIFKRISMGIVHTDTLNEKLKRIGIFNLVKIEYPVFNKNLDIDKNMARKILRLPQGERIMLVIGGISYYKGIDILLDALNMVKKSYVLYIAGMVNDFSEEYLKSKTINYKNKIILNIKRLSDEEFSQAIIAADIILLPYRRIFDGASGPMIEGVWYRKYIIGAEHGSMGDIIKKYSLGRTFITENSEDLSRIIDSVLGEDLIWDFKAEEFRKNLTIDTFLLQYKKIYLQNID